jgi:cell division protein FtsL
MKVRRRGRGWSVLCAVFAALVLTTALSIVQASHLCRQHYARLQALDTEQWQMQEQWGRLLLEQSTWASHHRVERLARKELGMRLPSPGELEVVLP